MKNRRGARALGPAGVVIALAISGCSAAIDAPTAPNPAEGCYPNHSGVCEGRPLTAEEMPEVYDLLRRLQARDTTEGRDIEL